MSPVTKLGRSAYTVTLPRSVYDVPAERCRVDGTDGESRVDINIIMEDSICKKSSGLHRVREKAPYLPSINLRANVRPALHGGERVRTRLQAFRRRSDSVLSFEG